MTITPDKVSPLPVDLTEVPKSGERIVVKLENGVLKPSIAKPPHFHGAGAFSSAKGRVNDPPLQYCGFSAHQKAHLAAM